MAYECAPSAHARVHAFRSVDGQVVASAAMETADFWSANQPGTKFAGFRPGTPEFFAEAEAQRYALEPHIPEIARFEDWHGKDVLDVGCGIATDGIRFARAGARYVGVDASPVALDLARRRFEVESREVTLVRGVATSLPFDDASFDLIWSHGVIHHIEQTEAAVAEFYRVLRPGGVALVMLYHRRSFNYLVTIMGLRRIFAVLLLAPRSVPVLAKVTRESPAVLEGHKQLLREHGVHYLTDRQLFLSNNTDGPGNPLAKVYTRDEARTLFGRFRVVATDVRYLNMRLYPGGEQLAHSRLGRALSKRIGWHLYVRALR